MKQLLRLARMAGICLTLLVSACAPLPHWEPDPRYKELPSAQGQVVEPRSRRTSCMMCPTSITAESAFFLGGKKYDLNEAGLKAEPLLDPIRQQEGWQAMGTNLKHEDRYFAPIRIFLVSVDPIVLVTIPWTYQAQRKPGFYAHDLTEEANTFSESDYRGNAFSHVHLHWAPRLLMPIEFRSTLPAETRQARVITAGLDTVAAIPAETNGKAVVALGTSTLVLTRAANGKVVTALDLR